MIRLILLLFIILGSTGCMTLIEPNNPITTDVSARSLEAANKSPIKVRRNFQPKSALIDSLPIGSIIAFAPFHSLNVPENWMYCNGDVITDQDSPLKGHNTPNLMSSNVFLMGSIDQFSEGGGSNTLETSGAHNHNLRIENDTGHDHGGATSVEENNGYIVEAEQPGEIGIRLLDPSHTHGIAESSHSHNATIFSNTGHNHGGDKRPRWFGVTYIIKIK